MKSWNRNWNLPAFLLFNIVLFSGILYYDVNRHIKFGTSEVIGKISFKLNTIQRKIESSSVWKAIGLNAEIRNKDTLRTFSESDAIILLEDGTEIKMDENSMVFLDIKNNLQNINFEGGSIQVNTTNSKNPNQAIVVNTKNQTLTLNGGDAKINSSNNDVKVFLEKGNATLEGNGKKQTLGEADSATLDSNGFTTKSSPYILQEPANQQKLISMNSSIPIDFKWKTRENTQVGTLEISHSESFKKIVIAKQSNELVNLKLNPGTYFWRVKGNGEVSETRKFTLIKESGLKLFSPLQGSVHHYKNGKVNLLFSWTPSDTYNDFVIELATNSNFTSSVRKIDGLRTNSYNLNDLQEGVYYWRVIAKTSTPGIPSITSQESSFVISSNEDPKSLTLLYPNANDTIPFRTPQSPITLKWAPSQGAKKFLVQVSQSSEFQNLITNQTVSSSNITINLNKEGTYHWRVAQYFGNAQSAFSTRKFTLGKVEVEPTETETIDNTKTVSKTEDPVKPKEVESTIGTQTPTNLKPTSGKFDITKQKSIRFSWNKVNQASYYLFQILSTGKKSKVVMSEKTTKEYYILNNFSKLNEGVYFWEVKPFDKKNKVGKTARGKFSIDAGTDPLKNLKPEEIKILSPDTIYRDK